MRVIYVEGRIGERIGERFMSRCEFMSSHLNWHISLRMLHFDIIGLFKLASTLSSIYGLIVMLVACQTDVR